MYINKSLSCVEAKKIMDTEEDIIILDVRTKEEFEEKHIPNAISVPLSLLQEDSYLKEKLSKIIPLKDTKVLIYCLTNRRSFEALKILISEGYNNSYNFDGIKSWPFEVVM